MKKVLFAASALAIMISQTGCFGSFSLVRTIYDFNDSVSDNKVVKTLVFYALNIIPVYGAAGFVDVVVLNLIEFWTGSNPLSMEVGEVEEQLLTIKGEEYRVKASKNKMEFIKLEGDQEMDMGVLTFDTKDNSWNFEKDGELNKIASYDETAAKMNFFSAECVTSVDMSTIELLANNDLNSMNTTAMLAQ